MADSQIKSQSQSQSYSDEIMEKVVAEKEVLLTPYSELSPKDKEMAQLMVYMIKDQDTFAKYLGIRKVERKLTEGMNTFTMRDMNITMHDLTRFLMKHAPTVLKAVDEALDSLPA